MNKQQKSRIPPLPNLVTIEVKPCVSLWYLCCYNPKKTRLLAMCKFPTGGQDIKIITRWGVVVVVGPVGQIGP